ncbi:hypothetical protein CYMTET_28611 [Cymbomonas tetramitiformis]|uniref:Uncharacterized protein n=1 Tax=Cymbomonas tetramitiformis TaxID=36881 RepID=A0AAE0FMG8_9CHLO|nr:hypothetical protein CYMTET_28611 [Cymbomonas tetramitiformis]
MEEGKKRLWMGNPAPQAASLHRGSTRPLGLQAVRLPPRGRQHEVRLIRKRKGGTTLVAASRLDSPEVHMFFNTYVACFKEETYW